MKFTLVERLKVEGKRYLCSGWYEMNPASFLPNLLLQPLLLECLKAKKTAKLLQNNALTPLPKLIYAFVAQSTEHTELS